MTGGVREPSEWTVLKQYLRSIRFFLLVVAVIFLPSIVVALVKRNLAGLELLAVLLVILIPVLVGILYSLRRKDLKIQIMLGREIDRIGPAKGG